MTLTAPVKASPVGDIMESVLIKGDLARLTPDERVRYYNEVCRSVGLNPLTKPFDYINLNGKVTLYALRTCADQLRKINGVSLEIVSREVADEVLTIHVRAKTPDGRVDEDLGVVAYPPSLRGEAKANAELKAITKAKRRATLSICGLGWLDETEVDDIPTARPKRTPELDEPMPGVEFADEFHDEVSPIASPALSADQGASPQPLLPGNSGEAPEVPDSARVQALDNELAAAAETGDKTALKAAWDLVPTIYKPSLKSALDRRHKPRCEEVARG